MTLLTRRLTGRVAARAGMVAFAKAVAKAGGAATSAASAASTPALAHNAAAATASPASASQTANCPVYEKGHPVSLPSDLYGGGTLEMLGDCHGKIAAKVVTNQPSQQYRGSAGALIEDERSGAYASCTVSPQGSQYACTTAFVPLTGGNNSWGKATVLNDNSYAIADLGGQFYYYSG